MAAVLAGGPNVFLSHGSAAALWGIGPDPGAPVNVISRLETRRARPGLVIHCGTTLADVDLTSLNGIPCTALPRTLLNLAAVLDRRRLQQAIDRAETIRVFDLGAVEALLARSRGIRGAGLLASTLASYAGPTVTRSEVEERFLALVTNGGMPPPAVNGWIPLPEGGGFSPDFFWRTAGLIVEVDGRAYHARRRAFEHDRRRDRRLALAGFETRRYSASEVIATPARVARELKSFLAARDGNQ